MTRVLFGPAMFCVMKGTPSLARIKQGNGSAQWPGRTRSTGDRRLLAAQSAAARGFDCALAITAEMTAVISSAHFLAHGPRARHSTLFMWPRRSTISIAGTAAMTFSRQRSCRHTPRSGTPSTPRTIGPGQLYQRNLVRTQSLAWPTLAVEDRRQAFIAHVGPLQSDELLDALAAGQQMQPQRGCLDAWTGGDQLPVHLQVGLGERSFVGAIELRGSTRLCGWVEHDPEGLEDHRDRRSGANIQRALERRAEVRAQLVGSTPLVGLGQPAYRAPGPG